MENAARTMRNLHKKLSANATVVFCSTAMLFILLLVAAIIHSNSAIKAKQQELLEVQEQCVAQQVENDALKELIENSDDEYIEHVVREEHDYVRPGERVYIVRSGN